MAKKKELTTEEMREHMKKFMKKTKKKYESIEPERGATMDVLQRELDESGILVGSTKGAILITFNEFGKVRTVDFCATGKKKTMKHVERAVEELKTIALDGFMRNK